MTDTPQPHSIELHSGNYFDFDKPSADVVLIEDIAHHLSICNRFTGATQYPYSVAQHAVFVSRRLERLHFPVEVQFGGLNHDNAEYVMNDTAKPLKMKLAPEEREALEKKVDAVIVEALDFDYLQAHNKQWKADIKAADTYAVLIEALNMLPSKGAGWRAAKAQEQWLLAGGKNVPKKLETPDYFRGELSWREARDEWLARYDELKEALNG